MQDILHIPYVTQHLAETTCTALLWSDGGNWVVLLVDRDNGVSVATGADIVIPLLITQLCSTKRVARWSNVRWFQCDVTGSFDEIRVEQYKGGMIAEITWLPRPAPLRTLNGFVAIAAKEGFDVSDCVEYLSPSQRAISAIDRSVSSRRRFSLPNMVSSTAGTPI